MHANSVYSLRRHVEYSEADRLQTADEALMAGLGDEHGMQMQQAMMSWESEAALLGSQLEELGGALAQRPGGGHRHALRCAT